MKNLAVQLRVIFALVLREARVRHGRARIGYLWAIIEPVMLISILTILFSQFREGTFANGSFALFFATGVLAFQSFRNTSTYISGSFEQNRPLFNYPMVKPLDTAFARVILDGSTHVFVMFLVITFQITALDAPIPNSIPKMALAIFLMLSLAFGTGVSLAVVRRFVPSMANLYQIVMGPAFFVSCVFFSLASIPTFYRNILSWNPLVHGVEAFRSGYYPIYPDSDVDIYYLVTWVIALNFFGFVGEWLTRFKST